MYVCMCTYGVHVLYIILCVLANANHMAVKSNSGRCFIHNPKNARAQKPVMFSKDCIKLVFTRDARS